MGLHTDARRPESRRASRGPLDHRSHIESARPGPSARAPDLLADVSAGALGRDCRSRLLHHGSVDRAGTGDLLHALRHRLGVTAGPDSRLHAASRCSVHAPDHPRARLRRRWGARPPPGAHLRSGCQVELHGPGPLTDAGLRVAQAPYRAPNANAHAERFVRSIKEECLDRIVPLGERHFRRTVFEFVSHYHRERPQQGCGNTLLEPRQPCQPRGRITRRPRLGGLLNFYARAA